MEDLKILLLWLLPAAIILSLVAGVAYLVWRLAIKPHESAAARRRFRALSCLVAVILFGDEIWGQVEVRLLCLGGASIAIYKKVSLTNAQLKAESLSIPIQYRSFMTSSLSKTYNLKTNKNDDIVGPVSQINDQLVVAASGEVLGRATHYHFRRGWFVRSIPFMSSRGVGCKGRGSTAIKLLESVFVGQ